MKNVMENLVNYLNRRRKPDQDILQKMWHWQLKSRQKVDPTLGSCLFSWSKVFFVSYFKKEMNRGLVVYGLGVLGLFWDKKIKQEKLIKSLKLFKLYEVFMHNFCPKKIL